MSGSTEVAEIVAPPERQASIVRTRAATPSRRRYFVAGFLSALCAIGGGRLVVNETAMADHLVSPLVVADSADQADAIVALGGGLIGDCVLNTHSLRRTILAARLWRERRASQVLFTGGQPDRLRCSVAEVMARFAEDLGVPRSALHVENASATTRENAMKSAPILNSLGVQRVVIVTDRLHMLRAAGAFAQYGFSISTASVPIYAGHADNISMLARAAREAVALGYYHLRGWVGELPQDAPAAVRVRRPAPSQSLPATGTTGMTSTATTRPVVILGASYAGGWQPDSIDGRAVVNRGIQGQQSWEMLARFDRDVTEVGPAAVILWGFINDVFRNPREQIDGTLARAREAYLQMIKLAEAGGVDAILATEVTIRPIDSWSETLMAWVGWALGKESYQAWVNRHVRETNRWLRETALERNLLLLDFERVLGRPDGDRRREFAKEDGSHITPAGYQALTRYARPLLQKRLQASSGK